MEDTGEESYVGRFTLSTWKRMYPITACLCNTAAFPEIALGLMLGKCQSRFPLNFISACCHTWPGAGNVPACDPGVTHLLPFYFCLSLHRKCLTERSLLDFNYSSAYTSFYREISLLANLHRTGVMLASHHSFFSVYDGPLYIITLGFGVVLNQASGC